MALAGVPSEMWVGTQTALTTTCRAQHSPAGAVASDIDVDKALVGVESYAASVSDDIVTDLPEGFGGDVFGVDVGGESVDVGGVGDSAHFSVVRNRAIT